MEISAGILTLIMLGSLVLFMLLGVPVPFALGGIAVGMLWYLGGIGAITGGPIQ